MFEFSDTMVEIAEDKISYDFLSFIGECGGMLGLTLGLSGLSLVELGLGWIKKLKNAVSKSL